jgi:hypothetical protein
MTTTQERVLVPGTPRVSGLRPTLWVLAYIALLGVGLPAVDAMVGTTLQTDGTPLDVGQGVQITPADGWGVDEDATQLGETAVLVKGGTSLTVEARQSAAPLPDLWQDVREQVSERVGANLVSNPGTTATQAGVHGLRAPLSTSRVSGLAAVYSDEKTAVLAIAEGNRYRGQAGEVTAMLATLRFGVEEESS